MPHYANVVGSGQTMRIRCTPGASIAFSAVGILMLIFLGVDWLVARTTGATSSDRRPVALQLVLAAAIAGLVGGVIALVAWVT